MTFELFPFFLLSDAAAAWFFAIICSSNLSIFQSAPKNELSAVTKNAIESSLSEAIVMLSQVEFFCCKPGHQLYYPKEFSVSIS